jgi:hypothetical protein
MIQKKEKKIPIKGVSEKPVKQTICSKCQRNRPYANKSKKICAPCVKKLAEETAKQRRANKREKKRMSISQLTKKLDTIFSIYIRLENANKNGMVKCFTCDSVHHYKAIQNGHFQSRRFMSTRFDPFNCAPQCYACNVGMSGMQYEFGKRIDLKYGAGIADLIAQKSKVVKKFIPDELVEMIEYFKEKVDKLKKEKDIFD